MTRKLLLLGLGLALVFAVPALADHGRGKSGDDGKRGEHRGVTLLASQVAPTVPTDPVVHGVKPGGAPWVLDHGKVRLRSDGRLHVEVEGLVIPTAPQNGTNPVPMLAASLFCGSDTPAASTDAVPFSTSGDAEIEAKLALPAKCLAPVVLLRVNSAAGPYIAASGFGG
jgi:hypothetical protein